MDELPLEIAVKILQCVGFTDLAACAETCRALYAAAQTARMPWLHLDFTIVTFPVTDGFVHAVLMEAARRGLFPRFISLAYCSRISDNLLLAFEGLVAVQRLEGLCLDSCDFITDRGIHDLVAACPGLRRLDVQRCRGVTDISLLDLQSLSSLEDLRISHMYASDEDLNALLLSCSALTHITLTNCYFVSEFALLNVPKGIKVIEIISCPLITDSLASVLEQSGCLGSLEALSVNGCANITDEFVIRVLKQGCSLVRLDVGRCYIVSDDALLYLDRCPQLAFLSIAFNSNVTDMGASRIALRCSGLKEIDIVDCPEITEKGVGVLAKAGFYIRRQ